MVLKEKVTMIRETKSLQMISRAPTINSKIAKKDENTKFNDEKRDGNG